MVRPSPRFAKTTWLAVTVAVLLPALAWLQYDWVNQIAAADRDRSRRTLRAASSQFTAAVDAELSRVSGNLQLDGAMVERRDWDAYALRYASAVANAATAALVKQVWFVESLGSPTTHDARLVAHQWVPGRRSFDEVEWPAALTALRAQLQKFVATAADDAVGRRERIAATAALGDERTLVSPVLRVSMLRPGDATERLLPDVQVRGFTVVSLAIDTLTGVRLPALVAEHFPEAADYRVAIVAKDGGRVVFESEPGAAAATAAAPDITASFLQSHVGPMMVFARVGADGRRLESRPEPPSPGAAADLDEVEVDADAGGRGVVSVIEVRDGDDRRTVRTRAITRGQGHWELRVQHRAGSLEAAVAASRRRNLTLSGSVLLLLGVAVAIIAVSARRAQALARQQLEFVAAVSHELRTPVAVINSAAGNLADGVVGDPARVKRYGTTIQTEARRLGDTVERVLQLAGLGSGRVLPMAPVAASTIVEGAVQQSSLDADRAGVDVHVDLAPDLPLVVGEAGALQSAVQNLIGNAIKYAGEDRWVRVHVEAPNGARGREVRIAVEDHGPGLDADERQLIFEPFYRGRTAVANQIQGSGLGLSLVRRIAEAHGGRVELTTEAGRGSTFTLCLPAAPPEARVTESSAARQAGSPSAAPAAS
ncbi:MAG TPA: HAMP domain-containing sensor histidine kinase [Vicinamibacterales bacterium]|nr:HAMP domain-containing sensor histidine kinase [Vicinamibacterales bacterium]